MQLNIYIISHPLIQNLSQQIINHTLRKYTYNCLTIYYKQIGQLMIYEAIRKWIKNQKIYIKTLNTIKELSILHPKESYIIIADLINSHELVSEIPALLPESNIIHRSLDKQILLSNEDDIINQIITKKDKIFIIIKFLNSYSIIKLIQDLISKKHVKLNQICIICITCDNKILDKIGSNYPHLNIYTTKIITT